MNEIENAYFFSGVINILPASKIERQKWGENIIFQKIDDGVYIFTFTVTNIKETYITPQAFL